MTAEAWKQIRRILIAAGGFAVILLGIIMLPLPGPGGLIIAGGLAILATEFQWAKKLLKKSKAFFGAVWQKVFNRKPKKIPIPATLLPLKKQ